MIGGSSVSQVAKPLEQAIAVGGLLLAGTIGGAVLFALLRLPSEPALLLSAILGAGRGFAADVLEATAALAVVVLATLLLSAASTDRRRMLRRGGRRKPAGCRTS